MNDNDNDPTEVEQTLENAQRYRYLRVPEGLLRPTPHFYIAKDGTVSQYMPLK